MTLEVMNRLVRDSVDALISNDIRALVGVVGREARV